VDLKSGQPYYLIKSGLCEQYKTLQADAQTNVLILGGGISGALMAYELGRQGIDCMVIDKRAIGLGSTCASTSLLQYEIDVPLHQLQQYIGKEKAIAAYQLCLHSIGYLKEIADTIGFTDFSFCQSLYFSGKSRHEKKLRREFECRKEAGFEVAYLEEKEIRERFGLRSGAAILSARAAKTDAYQFTHHLHSYNKKYGIDVFENTCIKTITPVKEGFELHTEKGQMIRAKQLVHATGYESLSRVFSGLVKLRSTYACASERMEALPDFFKQQLFWNTADPYLYIRESENRIIIGGRDEKYINPDKRERLLKEKTTELEKDFNALFPGLSFRPQFSWAGTFVSTKDGLPYIGPCDKEPGSYFALGYGGNGITFSALAAKLVAGVIKDKRNRIPDFFSFGR
jgi:glycine/D-amino acid oxidase-like deaminating enzyme